MRRVCQGPVRTPPIFRSESEPGVEGRLACRETRSGSVAAASHPSSRAPGRARAGPAPDGRPRPWLGRRRRRRPSPPRGWRRQRLLAEARGLRVGPPEEGHRLRHAVRPGQVHPREAAAARDIALPEQRPRPFVEDGRIRCLPCGLLPQRDGPGLVADQAERSGQRPGARSGRACTWLKWSSALRPSPSRRAIQPSRWWRRPEGRRRSSRGRGGDLEPVARASSPSRNSRLGLGRAPGGAAPSGSVRQNARRPWKFWNAKRRAGRPADRRRRGAEEHVGQAGRHEHAERVRGHDASACRRRGTRIARLTRPPSRGSTGPC